MNLFDATIGISLVSAMVGGWRLGFVARVFSWLGLACGLYLAVRLLPNALDRAHGSDPVGKLLLAAGLLIGAGLIGQVLGMLVGTQARRVLAPGPLGLVDRSVGSAVGGVGILISLWLLLPSMAQVPGWPSQQAHNSAVARFIDRVAPPAPDTLQTVRRLVGDEAFPRVFDALRPAPDAGPPPTAVPLSPEVQAAVAVSSVKIEGEACRRLQQGSGFVVGPDLVATNAHVVAGERSTQAIRVDGQRLRATVVAFDPDRDLAILRVPGIKRAPLPIGVAKVGSQGAVFGHPDGQDQLRIAAAAVRQEVEALGRDLYDSHQTKRQVFILAAGLRPGDSGGALVDPSGKVVGVAFAIAPDRPDTAYALTSAELRAVLATARGPVGTGPCLR